MKDIGERVKLLRQKQGMTQVQLGECVNVTGPAVTQWETGKRTPDWATIEKLSHFFNVPIEYLVGLPEASSPPSDWQEVIERAKAHNLTPADVQRAVELLIQFKGA